MQILHLHSRSPHLRRRQQLSAAAVLRLCLMTLRQVPCYLNSTVAQLGLHRLWQYLRIPLLLLPQEDQTRLGLV